MSDKTAIAWTDATFNVAWGCTKISPGCTNCYADRDSHRHGFDVWGPKADRRTFGEKHWNEPKRWERTKLLALGRRPRVFTSSMCDVLEDHPTIREQLPRLLALIDATPNIDWQVLTKRAENLHLIPKRPNVWLGVSVESPDYFHRIDALRSADATVRFVSFEPLLADVSEANLSGIHWAIFGGESGPGARPLDVEWLREGVDTCRNYCVAPFVKQFGAHPYTQPVYHDGKIAGGVAMNLSDRWHGGDPSEWPEDLRVREFPR